MELASFGVGAISLFEFRHRTALWRILSPLVRSDVFVLVLSAAFQWCPVIKCWNSVLISPPGRSPNSVNDERTIQLGVFATFGPKFKCVARQRFLCSVVHKSEDIRKLCKLHPLDIWRIKFCNRCLKYKFFYSICCLYLVKKLRSVWLI